MSGRTPSKTEIALNKTTNIRNTPDIKAAAMQNVVVREPNTLIRSNVNPTGVPTRVIQSPPVNTTGNDIIQDVPNTVATAGFNWLLPLVIIGGFFAASKLKKKKKNV